MYLTAPLVYGTLQRYPTYSRKLCLVGFVILLAGLIGASFANTVSQLLATQGILYGVGGSLLYFPVFIYLDEWFNKRRGLAYGIAIAGDGAGGVITPLAMEWILQKWHFRTAMRAWAIVFLLLTSLSLFFLKHRVTDRQSGQNSRGFDMRFLKSPAFWILQAGNAVQALGFYMPLLYMPCESPAYPIIGSFLTSCC
jgi:MFS family permease